MPRAPHKPAALRDADRGFARAILMRGCLAVGVACALGLILRLVVGSPFDAGTVVGIVGIVTSAASVALLRAGRAQPATVIFLSLSWVLVGGIAVARGPAYPATIPLYLLLILLAGMLLSARAAIILAVLSTAATMAMMLGQDLHAVPSAQPIGVAYRAGSAAVVIIVVTLTFLAALRRLREAHLELAKKNEELERTRASLAQTVEERTRSLVEARDAAEAASRTKTAFLANMSHELRTPMNAVLGSTDLLLQTSLDDQQMSLVQTIRGGGDALLAVLNDVLDLRAVEAGRLSVERAPFSPAAVAEEVAGLLRPEAQRTGLALDVHVDDGAPATVRGDVRRVRQVLLNLVGNAVKFTEKGSVSVRVSAEPGGVRFAVSDTGTGIRPEDHERIFLPFTQLDSSSTRRRGGIGLGLAISRELAALMGGELRVDSAPGGGATFRFEIPVDLPAGATPARAAPPPLPAALQILVAEDNEVNVRVLLGMLALLGLSADVVGTGAAALAAVRRTAYDCVLMDVHMPEMDGLEATRRIRAESASPPAVVAVTADALPEQRAELSAAGFDEVITKPILLDALSAALARALAAREEGRQKSGIPA